MRYILIWRRSPTARYIDVELNADDSILVTDARDESVPLLSTEQELVAYVNGEDTQRRQVDADLAHRVLGWSI